jgi:DNA (cytosine-5)-methyltransferase 1
MGASTPNIAKPMPKSESKPLIKRTDAELDAFAAVTHRRSHPTLYQNSAKPSGFGITRGALAEIRSIVRKSSLRKDHPLRKETRKEPRFTFIDLFAGIGGFRLAGENSGGTCIFTSEKDKFARISYFQNFGDLPFGDINVLASPSHIAEIPHHDVLCGGFPCQAFSISGNQKGFDDERGALFFRIRDILEHRVLQNRPVKVVFLENVRNFRNHGKPKKSTFAAVKNELAKLGYDVYDVVLNSGHHGASTKRERIYIVAIQTKLSDSETIAAFGKEFLALEKEVTPGPPVKYHLESLSEEDRLNYIIPRNRIVTKSSEMFALDEATKSAPKSEPVQIGQIGKEGDPRKGRQGERIYSIHGHAITFSAYGGGLAARTGAYLINGNIRKLTPVECAKIMGFYREVAPAEFRSMDIKKLNDMGLSDWQLYKQFGNSVVVPTVEKIYQIIAKHFFPVLKT